MIKRLTYFVLCALLTASCIYPYEHESASVEERTVMSGDIRIGDYSVLNVSKMLPLTAGDSPVPELEARVYVEAGDGTRYPAVYMGSGTYRADTRGAAVNLEYRAVAEVAGQPVRSYVSEWETPAECSIDGLYFEADRQLKVMDFFVDFSSKDGPGCYDVSYSETWEYHSTFYATCYYVPFQFVQDREKYPYGMMAGYPAGGGNYYCWQSSESTGKTLVSSESLEGNRVKGHKVLSIEASDERLSVCYRLTAKVACLSEDAYQYARHRETVSSGLGDLFSPMPSEMHGNVTCQEDPEEVVIGYVGVSSVATAVLYEIEDSERFYRLPFITATTQDYPPEMWPSLYRDGKAPVARAQDGAYSWTEARCVDCLSKGGTKTVPEGWPTGHK